MAKQHVEPPSGGRRRAARRAGPDPVVGWAGAVPGPATGAALGRAPVNRLVVARTELARLPEVARQLVVRGLRQVGERHAVASGGEVTVQRQPSPLQTRAATLRTTVEALIAGADWPTMRKRLYPQVSAAGIARAKERKAGKATDLTGLGKIAALDRFAGAMKAIQADWPTKSVRQRIDMVGAAANAELVQAGVPTFMIVDKAAMSAKGSFSAGDWEFLINEALVTVPTLDAATAGQLANAAMHESRHAEQHFLAARYSAGFNKTDAAGLVAEQGIPIDIAKAAVKKKFDAMSDMAVAMVGQRMFSRYVTDRDKNEAAAALFDTARETMNAQRGKTQTAFNVLARTVTAASVAAAETAGTALKAAITEVHKGYLAYRGIPSEADAHEVGDAAELAFRGWK